MSGLRDYEQWHRRYDDPNSDLSWRLRTVQGYLRQALDRYTGPIRMLSCCSGDGRDVLEVLAQRSDAERVSAVLVEAHPVIADRARRSAAAVAAHVEVRTADAGVPDTYLGVVPAEVVLLVGIFGNISDTDLARTIATAPALCRPGATRRTAVHLPALTSGGSSYHGMCAPRYDYWVKVDKMSISLDAELGDAVRDAARRTGKGLSSWLAEAAETKLRAEALGQFLDEWEREHGPLTAAELERAERELGLRAADPAA